MHDFNSVKKQDLIFVTTETAKDRCCENAP